MQSVMQSVWEQPPAAPRQNTAWPSQITLMGRQLRPKAACRSPTSQAWGFWSELGNLLKLKYSLQVAPAGGDTPGITIGIKDSPCFSSVGCWNARLSRLLFCRLMGAVSGCCGRTASQARPGCCSGQEGAARISGCTDPCPDHSRTLLSMVS